MAGVFVLDSNNAQRSTNNPCTWLNPCNQRSERPQASSPERQGYRQIVFAGTGWEAIALGISWVGWRSPEAPRGQQRLRNSDRASERSRDLIGARVVLGGKYIGMRNLVCEGLDCFWSAADGLGCAKVELRLLRWSDLSQWRFLASQAADNTPQICLASFD